MNKLISLALLAATFGAAFHAPSASAAPDSEAYLTEQEEQSIVLRRIRELTEAHGMLLNQELHRLLPFGLRGLETFDTSEGDEVILPTRGMENHVAESLNPVAALTRLHRELQVEVYLPQNRCETGFVKWGDRQNGFKKCLVLGRGESLFGSSQELAAIRALKPDKYGSWILGQVPAPVLKMQVKEEERLGAGENYGHCMYKPDIYSQGATIVTRPESSIGMYTLDTGRSIHPGKPKWGKRDGKFILPVRMNKVPDPRNERYRDQGELVDRFDFWFHAYENESSPFPLEGLSTWGCVRIPQNCQLEIQKWVALHNAEEDLPKLVVIQNDERVVNYPNE